MPEGYGFLRSSDYNYLASPDDIYVTQAQIKANGLKAGDVVECTINPPREGEKYFPMDRALTINGRQPEFIRDRVPFEHLTPLSLMRNSISQRPQQQPFNTRGRHVLTYRQRPACTDCGPTQNR